MRYCAFVLLLVGSLIAIPAASAADVMARQTLTRGHVLSGSDIEIYPAAGEDPYKVARRFVGMQVKRTVYAGHPVTTSHLQMPLMVERNKMVTMIYQFGSLKISTTGRALDEGGDGDLVQVMNMESRKKVQAVVTGPDEVTVR